MKIPDRRVASDFVDFLMRETGDYFSLIPRSFLWRDMPTRFFLGHKDHMRDPYEIAGKIRSYAITEEGEVFANTFRLQIPELIKTPKLVMFPQNWEVYFENQEGTASSQPEVKDISGNRQFTFQNGLWRRL